MTLAGPDATRPRIQIDIRDIWIPTLLQRLFVGDPFWGPRGGAIRPIVPPRPGQRPPPPTAGPGTPPPGRPPGPVRGGGPGLGPPTAAPYIAAPPPGFYAPGWDAYMECATRAGRASVHRGRSTDGEIADAIYKACGGRPPGLIPDEYNDYVIPKVPIRTSEPPRALLGPLLQRAIPIIIRALPRIGAPLVIPAPAPEPEPEPEPELAPLPRGPTHRPRIAPPIEVPELEPFYVDIPRIVGPTKIPAPERQPGPQPIEIPLNVPEIYWKPLPLPLPSSRPLPLPRSRPVPAPGGRPSPRPTPSPFPTPRPITLPRWLPYLLPFAVPFALPSFDSPGLRFTDLPQPQPTPTPTPTPRPPPDPLTPPRIDPLPFPQPFALRSPFDPCQCTETKPKRKPRKQRTKCREGTYRETRKGLNKSPKRTIPCR